MTLNPMKLVKRFFKYLEVCLQRDWIKNTVKALDIQIFHFNKMQEDYEIDLRKSIKDLKRVRNSLQRQIDSYEKWIILEKKVN